jgi:hypothetical protein
MTITRREKSVPIFLPAAKFYLDDIEEIVYILTEAGNQLEVQPGRRGTEITFEVGDRLCDEVQDLPKIAKRSYKFQLKLASEQRGYSAFVSIAWWGCLWTTVGLPKEVAWSAFRKLEAVFNSRKLHRLSIPRPPWLLHYAFASLLTGLLTRLIFDSAMQLLKIPYKLNPYVAGGLASLLPLAMIAIITMKVIGGVRGHLSLFLGPRRST